MLNCIHGNTKYYFLYLQGLYFPTVTICNYNLVRKSEAIQDDLLNQAALLSSELTRPLATLDLNNDTVLAQLAKYDVHDVMRRGAHVVNETFLECR